MLGQHRRIARRPAFEAERAGRVDRLDAEVGAELLGLLDVQDGVEVLRHLIEQLGERLLELVLDRDIVGRGDLVDVAHAPLHQALGLGIEPALVGRDHVLGGHLLAGAEGDVVAQLEGVGEAVGRHGPARGEAGLQRLHVVVEVHQRVADHVHDLGARAGRRLLRIVAIGVDLAHDGDGLLRQGRRRGPAASAARAFHAKAVQIKRLLILSPIA